MENNIDRPLSGLNTDNNYLSQPKGTYSFALNAVNESNEGDYQTLSNENSNEIFTQIKPDFLIIGSVYIGNGETCIFSVKSDNSESEIGILRDDKNYEVWCNDRLSDSKNKLNFRIDKQIQGVYKLRRGCEKNVYWTDNFNSLRQVNLNDKKSYFSKTNANKLEIYKFDLIKKIKSYNNFVKKIKVLNDKGFLPNGSIKVMLRFIDSYGNKTKFVYESSNLNIYPEISNKYEDIFGQLLLQ